MAKPTPISATQLRLIKPFMRWMTQLNVMVYKWSGGQMMGRYGGQDICLVKMTGAKSGQVKELPLMYTPYRDGVILVASMAGAPKHPEWYFNLVAHPAIKVTLRGRQLDLVARRASAEEKAAVWPLCCEHYPDFEVYRQRTDRDIPVFICEPATPH